MNMTFYIEKMILWLKNGDKRILNFKNDKVNIITGNSKTGKTAILEIIDYCFFGSHSNISYEHIGENVLWYGLVYHINGKKYTLARGEYINEKKMSKEYYFSSVGEIPNLPSASMGEKKLKKIIENEFSISLKTTFGYGGKLIKQNSKISFRYFMMFNTLSGDVIDHSKFYFDKLDNERYREALPRIFDLALGITTIENLAVKDKINSLEKSIQKIQREKENFEDILKNQKIRLNKVIKKAKELKIISPNLIDTNECVEEIKKILETGNLSLVEIKEDDELKKLKRNKQKCEIQIAKLKRFKNQYSKYKKSLTAEETALKPIKYINNKFSKNISNDEYRQFLNVMEVEFDKIRKTIKDKMPFEYNVDDEIETLQKNLSVIEEKLNLLPNIDNTIIDDKERLIAIGEIKTEFLELINQENCNNTFDDLIRKKEEELLNVKKQYSSTEERKLIMIEALNDNVQTYIKIAKSALDEYGDYLAMFDYNNKVLKLRKNRETTTANITSSSDHLFMHLCLFLGMHELIMSNNVPYIIPLLIIDQPSRPYFNNNDFEYNNSYKKIFKKSDWSKVKEIFNLFDKFFDNILKKENHFQIILLEHVSANAWEECNNIYLVEEFDGISNALIPPKKVNDN